MMEIEIIKEGPRHEKFARSVFDLLSRRIDDDEVTPDMIADLTCQEVGAISGRLAEAIIANLRAERAMANLRSMVDDVHGSKPS
tara:strand:- start:14933 stop:15184 length:252 start_codon:yes stop_codon:yes gene_type:complete